MRKKVLTTLLIILPLLGSIFAVYSTIAIPEQDEPIKIGMFTPDTAALGFYGTWVKQGFSLGLDYATDGTNETEDGREYEILYYDTQGDPTLAATLATEAIETDGCDILVGGTYSSVAAAIMPIAEKYKKIYFIVPGADSALTGKLFNKYCFRVARNSWHDAAAGAYYMVDILGAKNIAFLAADYSFGYSGVSTMSAEVSKRGGTVIAIEYASLATTDFTPYFNRLITINDQSGIDVLMIIWAGAFGQMYQDMTTLGIYDKMNVSGAVIDIVSMNIVEAQLQAVGATLEGQQGLCLYGYELPDNPVNDWMVAEHKSRNIKPNGAFGLNYRVPELFTASAFGTAQFLVNVTNEVSDLKVDSMISHLEGLNITTPKGPTYMRPQDHQALAEMYVAEAWLDNRAGSETNGQIIAKLVETLPALEVAPPIETDYEPETTGEEEDGARTPGFELAVVLLGISTWYFVFKKKKR
jgi:branched-chain amino acid transport system substrate-binding protein